MRRLTKGWIVTALSICMIAGSLLPKHVKAAEEESIKPSNVYYDTVLRDKTFVFIGNKKAVDWKVGDSYFMTYTVKSLDKDETKQSGIIATTDRDAEYPYLNGNMHFAQESKLLDAGYTYFVRVDVTEDGFDYTIGKAKGEESSYVQLKHKYENKEQTEKVKTPYFGIWLAQGKGATAELTKVQCYDKYGNDLGIYAPKASSITISEMVARNDVNHRYSFSIEKRNCIAFGNSKKTQSDAIFLEYTINNVEAEEVTQSGATMSNAPTDQYPHATVGYLNYSFHDQTEDCKLITEGAKYLVRFERGEKNFDVLVKRTTAKGAVDYFTYSLYAGKYDNTYNYVNMWIGDMCSVTADFTDVKCYDEAGNNLGIQTNKGVKVFHSGDLEDYSQCTAVYYCKDNKTFIALEDENAASKRVDGDTSVEVGGYSIADSVLTLKVGGEAEKYEYLYDYFKSEDGMKYERLREVDVTYMSDRYNGTVVNVMTVSAENGFKVTAPENPTKDGKTFTGWIDGKGKSYDFDEVVTEAKSLYATWDGKDNWTLTGFLADKNITGANMVVVTGVCLVTVAGTVTGIILLRKGKKKHAV